jgi:hypothetical protein
VQVCEVVENASGARSGGSRRRVAELYQDGTDRSQLLQVSQYRTRTGFTPASDDMLTTKDHPTYTRSPPICWSRERGIGEAHRVAGGRPQVCINFKMVGQVLEKRGIAAAFAKSVADVCDTLAAATSRLAADHPRPTDEATAECFRPMDQVVQGSS